MRKGKGVQFGKLFRKVGPLVAMAAAGGLLAGCQGGNITVNGETGATLSDLDMSGDAPEAVVLVGADEVVISRGDDFTIAVQGADVAKERVRFVLDDGTLTVLREEGSWNDTDTATIAITMPILRKVTIAGSGRIRTDSLAPEAEAVIAGSGRLSTTSIDVEKLDVTIAGSGHYQASGSAAQLELSVAGSGVADMADLMAQTVSIDIAGSGNSVLSSDGEVSASIVGSGNVTVRGSARCSVSSMGSGTLVCERRPEQPEAPAA